MSGPIAASIGFLTIFPVPRTPVAPGGLTQAVALFPLVGALLGAFLGGLGLVLDRALPAGPAAVLLIAAGALATGGLHLDGVMDTADGVFGGHTAEERLAIMRDSRVGAFGVIAGALVLLGQYACLSELTGTPRLLALVAAYTMSRWSMALALGAFPSARAGGLGATFQAAASRPALFAGTLIAVAVALLTGPLGVAALVSSGVVVLALGSVLARRLGGLTGDTYGALAMISETAILFLAVALRPR